MSRTLTLFPASARTADPAGWPRAETGFSVLPCADDADAVEAHKVAAEECLAANRYRAARRHLIAALRRVPDDARCRFLLGRAFADDPHGCDRRAARHYRKAVKLNASSPLYRAALGRALVRIDDTQAGVNVLRRAAEAAPADAEVLGIVAEGLREAGEADLAFELLSKARFLAPTDTTVRDLWFRTRFDVIAQNQKGTRTAAARTPTAPTRVVPFVRLVGGNTASAPRTRHDLPSRPAAHVGRLLRPYRG
jgi:tetratricopeptide (TPR) repeat protein